MRADKPKRGEAGDEIDMGAWIGIGAGLGTALGVVYGNIALGVALGAALGAVIGGVQETAMAKRGKKIK